MIIKNGQIVGKMMIGGSPVTKMYGGSDLSFNNGIENYTPVPTNTHQYAIANDISTYTDTKYIDVYDRATMRWYKLNNLNEYEEYGIYGTSRQDTYYVGKLVAENDSEYEWNGTEWAYVGEATVVDSWYAPTDDEIMDAGYSNYLCESGFTKYRFTIAAPATSRLRISDQECYPMGRINLNGPWDVGVAYDAGQTVYFPRGGMYEILGCGFEFGYVTEIYSKEYAAKPRPVFAKAYDTLALAEADMANVGEGAVAVLPNDDVYEFTSDGFVAVSRYKMMGRLSGDTECLYEPSSADKVVTSGWTAYLDNTKLETVIIDDATKIDTSAFSACSSLASAVIGSGVTTIAYGSFARCGNLRSVKFSDGLRYIHEYAFYDCRKLTGITIPSSVSSIGQQAFYECWVCNANYILPTTPPTIGTMTFNNASWNCWYYVPAASLNRYKTATNWKDFSGKIVAIP